MKKITTGMAATASVLAMLTACGSSSSSAKDGSKAAGGTGSAFNVLAVLPQSGPLAAPIGTPELNALNAATQVLNPGGGIGGRKIVVKTVDSKGDATTAVGLLTKALNSGATPNLVIDGASTAEALAMAPLLTKKKILSTSNSGSALLNDPAKYPYVFHVAPVIKNQVGALLAYLRSKGYQKIGLFTGNEGYGQSIEGTYASAMKAAGLGVESVTYSATQLDLTAPLSKLEATKPDAIVFEALGAAAPRVLKARQQAGITTPTVGDLSITSNVAAEVDPAALKGVSVFTFTVNVYVPPAQRSPQLTTFLSAVGKQPGGLSNAQTHYSSIPVYDMMQLTNMAAAQAKSLDSDKLKAALENLQPVTPKPYILYPDEGFSPVNHFIAPTNSDFKVIPLSPITHDGFFKP